MSILLAFAIQAGWEGRRDAEQREAILLGLASDFSASAPRLESMSAYNSTRLEASERLILLARAGEVSSDLAATVDTLVTDTYWGSVFQPARGTLDAPRRSIGLRWAPLWKETNCPTS